MSSAEGSGGRNPYDRENPNLPSKLAKKQRDGVAEPQEGLAGARQEAMAGESHKELPRVLLERWGGLEQAAAIEAEIDRKALAAGVVVFGAGGQVGREVVEACGRLGVPCLALVRAQADCSTIGEQEIAALVGNAAAVVNCAAYTDVASAEKFPKEAFPNPNWSANADFPIRLAAACAAAGRLRGAGPVHLVHFSTDFVFEGTESRPRLESDPTDPVNEYGKAKLAGEACSAGLGSPVSVLRAGALFGPLGTRNFPSKILAAAQKSAPSVVDDQWTSPVGARYAALAALTAAARMASGKTVPKLIHLASSPVSFHGFAVEILTAAQAAGVELACEPEGVIRSKSTDFPSAVARPAYSALAGSLALAALGIPPCDRKEALAYFVARFAAQSDGAHL